MKTQNDKLRHNGKFHWLVLPEAEASGELYDTVIDETENFAVLPTKGSIVPGWVLIVPKFPIARIADIPEERRSELKFLVDRTAKKLEAAFGRLFSFEHGGHRGSAISCGVDQAHLHLAALNFDLLDAAEASTNGGWLRSNDGFIPNSKIGQNEYWFASCGPTSISYTVRKPIPQFFRRLIAENENCFEYWDYRSNDFQDNVDITLKKMTLYG